MKSARNPYLRLLVAVAQDGPAGEGDLAPPLLRRVLGRALVARFCPFGEPRCQPPPRKGSPPPPPGELCHLAASCPYGVLYAASRSRRPPLALHCPAAPAGGWQGPVEITLYGAGCELYAWVLGALAEALGRGLGKTRHRWRLEGVARVPREGPPQTLCGPDLTELPPSLPPEELTLGLAIGVPRGPVAVELLSPARLVRDGKVLPATEPVPFEVLVARILDRFADLYGETASELLSPNTRSALEAEAARVPLLADRTEWAGMRDYSARGKREIHLGGRKGRLVYGPEAARFLPLLRAGEILHVGKSPTAGCGRIEVETPAPVASFG